MTSPKDLTMNENLKRCWVFVRLPLVAELEHQKLCFGVFVHPSAILTTTYCVSKSSKIFLTTSSSHFWRLKVFKLYFELLLFHNNTNCWAPSLADAGNRIRNTSVDSNLRLNKQKFLKMFWLMINSIKLWEASHYKIRLRVRIPAGSNILFLKSFI